MKYGAHQAGDQSMADQLKPLSDKLDINKIAEIKKKILSNRSNCRKMQSKQTLNSGERGSRWTETKGSEVQLGRGTLRLTGDDCQTREL